VPRKELFENRMPKRTFLESLWAGEENNRLGLFLLNLEQAISQGDEVLAWMLVKMVSLDPLFTTKCLCNLVTIQTKKRN
jgi:hypothetical protein